MLLDMAVRKDTRSAFKR